MEVRFWGGPLDGKTMDLEFSPSEPAPIVLPVWMEPEVIHDAFGSYVVPRVGHYERDGLPNQPPYVYSWRD